MLVTVLRLILQLHKGRTLKFFTHLYVQNLKKKYNIKIISKKIEKT